MEEVSIFKKALSDEANAIREAINYIIENELLKTIDIIKKTKGHVVVSGVGKSGHIGEKIAATLSSTGTPSFFMHATEAMHGDLGMLKEEDTVLLISNSGETKEAINIIEPIKRRNIKIIALTGNKNSTLAKSADAALVYYFKAECDHLNLAPTSSSTLTLAFGDALAITLSKMMNFSKDDFHMYHPGGSLGAKLSEEKDK